MWGIGYRTVAARMQSGRALKTASLGLGIAVGSEALTHGTPDSGYRMTTEGLLEVATALGVGGAAVAAGEAVASKLPSIAKGAQALAGFAGRGGPAGFAGGALLGYLLAYLAYYAANRGPGITPSFAGFTPVLDCSQQAPEGRDPLGNPAFCDILQVADKTLYAPYDGNDLAFGFQTQWKYLPLVNRWTTVTKYAAIGGAAARPQGVDQRTYSDEMLGAGYEALRNIAVNPWPEEDGEQARTGFPALPRVQEGYKPAISPAVDAEALPIGAMMPNANTMRLPFSAVRARRDAGNPYRVTGYGWHAGPRPGEFPPVAVPSPIKVPAVTVDRDGTKTPDRVNPNTRAAARTHERKVKGPTAVAAQQAYMQMFGAMTEIGEFVDAIYDALPTKIRQDDYFANGRHELGRDGKLWSIYQNYKAINVDLMVRNIVFNNLQDAVIGKASRDITVASGGSPLGRTLGLF